MQNCGWEAISSIVEILALIVSILALMVTFYFSKQVSKLAKEANDIATKSLIAQKNLNKKEENLKSNLFNEDEWKKLNEINNILHALHSYYLSEDKE